LSVDLDHGVVRDLTKNIDFKVSPLPDFMQKLLQEGGIINFYKKYARLPEVR
jgi:3-isopropylmalate/(R)-2-methylmalate dehydratase small subunit